VCSGAARCCTRLRLASGLVLFTFALTHFLNHAMGLVSLEAMVAVDHWRNRSDPLGRRHDGAGGGAGGPCRLGGVEDRDPAQLAPAALASRPEALGFAIPLFLLPHIVGTRIAATVFGVNVSYPYEIARVWAGGVLDQTLLLLIVWCMAASACISG